MLPRDRPLGSRRDAGFSLLELMAAVTIFLIIAAAAMTITDNASETALGAREARELRYLAEHQLELVKVFASEHDDILDGDFSDLHENYKDYEWTLDIRDVVVFGESGSEDAEYYFDAPEKDDDDEETTDPNNQQPQGETQELRELTLRVTAPNTDGEGSDYVEIVLLLPTLQ